MGLTGVIIAVVAVAWLAFGVPQFLSVPRAVEEEVRDPAEQIGGAVRILRAPAPAPAPDGAGQDASVPLVDAEGKPFARAEISTRLTRRAELARLRRIEVAAVRIRRRALLGVLLVDLLIVAGCLARWWPWWLCAGAGALLVAAVVGLRVSVVLVERELGRRIDALRTGNQERTLAISRAELQAVAEGPGEAGSDASRTSRDLVSVRQPLLEGLPSRHATPSLWEPVPVTAPTYVQRPIVARSVRTIDLASTDLNAAMDRAQGDVPVALDARRADGERASRRPKLRAVGE
ncbi:hypothetical protein [Raineyella fluvialis]|uniref:Uncharacterized protein n=1 Tax=Raineyella fluvialis TaxID=2662261 RepID=A0A5Q2FAZ1_9ACTN|nr:hypothetical protein [Raineyella fluvialis]QGF24032.1 hypothetical protein Rai3103_10460 [Raineyella fluvialis]